MKDYSAYLIEWLKEQLVLTNTKGFVVGISGGIDSAVVGALAKKATNNVLVVTMPINNIKKEYEDAVKIIKHLDVKSVDVDLSDEYNSLEKKLNLNHDLSNANIKPRLRMLTLYAYAQANNYLVLGTDNFIEYMIGYFTKHGDGACDLLPLVNLNKGEVKELAKVLKLPEFVISKKPTAGLWEGQTDEDEIGVSYDVLDQFSMGKTIDDTDKTKIEKLIKISAHKRNKAPMPKPYNAKINY